MHKYPISIEKMPFDVKTYDTPLLDYSTPAKNMPGKWAITSDMVMVDLSHPWGNDQPTWPAGAQPWTTPVQYMAKFNRRTQLLHDFPLHVSTHYDAPAHVCQESPFTDEVALEKFIAPA
ncbi:MAG: hypothetical protein H6Q73_4469, partial [Firmicutes bacterium]|nr:hypothetical protein [Bacillota bacterium]